MMGNGTREGITCSCESFTSGVLRERRQVILSWLSAKGKSAHIDKHDCMISFAYQKKKGGREVDV